MHKPEIAITDDILDALKELVNIGVGKAAHSLNDLLDSHIQLNVPDVVIVPFEKLPETMEKLGEGTVSAVVQGFKGIFPGKAALVFPQDSAKNLVSVFNEEDIEDCDQELVKETLTEIGNIVINGIMGAIGNVLKSPIDFVLPDYMEDSVANLMQNGKAHESGDYVLIAKSHFVVENQNVHGYIFLVFEMENLDALISLVSKTLLEDE